MTTTELRQLAERMTLGDVLGLMREVVNDQLPPGGRLTFIGSNDVGDTVFRLDVAASTSDALSPQSA
jgi:hypothetical protein